MSHKTYMADYFKDNYSHQASVIDVCATIEFLKDEPLEKITYNSKGGIRKSFYSHEECIEFFSCDFPKERRFRLDIDCKCLRIDEYNNDETSNNTFKKFLKCMENSAPDEYYSFTKIHQKHYDNYNKSESKNTNKIKKECNNMSNRKSIFPNLEVGKVDNECVKMSHLGIAVMNKEQVFVSYDKDNNALVNVDIASVDGESFLFKMPVQVSEIKVGDCIVHNDTYFYIESTSPLIGINYYDGVKVALQLTANMFGFNFVTKVFSMLDMANVTGNNNMNAMLPLMLMSKEEGSSNDMIKTMLMMQMMQQTNGNQGNQPLANNNMFNNPLMLMALAGDNDDIGGIMAMSMMMQQQQTTTPPVE